MRILYPLFVTLINWIRSCLFCPENVGKLSKLVRSSVSMICPLFVHLCLDFSEHKVLSLSELSSPAGFQHSVLFFSLLTQLLTCSQYLIQFQFKLRPNLEVFLSNTGNLLVSFLNNVTAKSANISSTLRAHSTHLKNNYELVEACALVLSLYALNLCHSFPV